MVACAIWGPYWQHRQVLVLSDNMAVVHVINSQSSKERTILHLLRCLHFICAGYDITLKADHIVGVHNLAADALSRNLMQVFRSAVPAANPQPTPVPQALWQLLVTEELDWRSPGWRQLLKTSLQEVSVRVQGEHTDQPRLDM